MIIQFVHDLRRATDLGHQFRTYSCSSSASHEIDGRIGHMIESEMVFTVEGSAAKAATPISLAEAGLKERQHLQEWVRANPEILGSDVMIVTLEFGRWTGNTGGLEQDRLDILGLSDDGHLVVVELKRDRAPDTVDMQALKYAALASRFTVDKLAMVHAEYLSRQSCSIVTRAEAADRLRSHTGGLTEEGLGQPRLTLMATEFPKTVTSTVAFLHQQLSLDVRLVSFQAYRTGSEILITVSQFYPPPKMTDFVLSPEIREAKEKQAAKQRKKSVRKAKLLYEAAVIPPGTKLTFNPPNESLKAAVEPWLSEDPARRTVTWQHHISKPLVWDNDEIAYSTSKLAYEIVLAATGEEISPQGPVFWVTSDGKTLAQLADELDEVTPDTDGLDTDDPHLDG